MKRAIGRGFGFAIGMQIGRLVFSFAVLLLFVFACIALVAVLTVATAHAQDVTQDPEIVCITEPPCGAHQCTGDESYSMVGYMNWTYPDQTTQVLWCKSADAN